MDNVYFGWYEKNVLKTRSTKDLWREAIPTLGKARYHYGCNCWLFPKGVKVPNYLIREKRAGRVIDI